MLQKMKIQSKMVHSSPAVQEGDPSFRAEAMSESKEPERCPASPAVAPALMPVQQQQLAQLKAQPCTQQA